MSSHRSSSEPLHTPRSGHGNVLAELLRGLRDAYNTDFLSSFYTAADMLRRGDNAIYCSSCLQAHAEQLFHSGPAVFSFQYDNPPLGAWLLQPLTYLTPQGALICFLLASLIAAGAAAWLLRGQITHDPRRLLIAVLAFASFPAAMTFAYGQWDAFLALAAAGAYVALRRDRQFLAGVLIAVLLFKPQVVWLVPVVVAVAGSWRVLLGIVLGGAVWAVSSVAILGLSDTLLWLREISPNIVARSGLSMPHMLVSFGASSAVVVASSAALAATTAIVLLVARSRLRSLSGQQQLSLGLLASMLAAPHLLSYDLIVLAPLIILWSVNHERHALIATLAVSAAFLADVALPLTWAIVEAPALLGVAAYYCHDLLSSRGARPAPTELAAATSVPLGTAGRA
jgi:alpha-1,2-mannosyltransferase